MTFNRPNRKVSNEQVRRAYETHGPKVSDVAKALGIAHETARSRLKNLGIREFAPLREPSKDLLGDAIAETGRRFEDVVIRKRITGIDIRERSRS